MEFIKYNGWDCVRLTNGMVELIVTREIGPRILRYGFVGGANVFGEIIADRGGKFEKGWVNRGGHRLWIAPEASPWSYEPDNLAYAEVVAIAGGIQTRQNPGPITPVEKRMDIVLDSVTGGVRVNHHLTNRGDEPVRLAVWAISVMGVKGTVIVPLPKKVPHDPCLFPTQHWALWSYTDFADPRWELGHDYLRLHQDPDIFSPQKVGLRHREGWVAYQKDDLLFVDAFEHLDEATYPDDGVNFEAFTNSEFLELETLGPLVTLEPGESASFLECWMLFRGLKPCETEADISLYIKPLAKSISQKHI